MLSSLVGVSSITTARLPFKNPLLIFIDEPTVGLDSLKTAEIRTSLNALKKSRSVVMISHSLAQITDADYTYVLQQNRVLEYRPHRSLYA